jgi:hypothetical protein
MNTKKSRTKTKSQPLAKEEDREDDSTGDDYASDGGYLSAHSASSSTHAGYVSANEGPSTPVTDGRLHGYLLKKSTAGEWQRRYFETNGERCCDALFEFEMHGL